MTEQILCCIDIGEYQLVNDEYHLRAFDFPIILLNQPVNIEPDFTSEFCLEDLLTYPMERKSSALKINVCFIVDKRFMYGKYLNVHSLLIFDKPFNTLKTTYVIDFLQ